MVQRRRASAGWKEEQHDLPGVEHEMITLRMPKEEAEELVKLANTQQRRKDWESQYHRMSIWLPHDLHEELQARCGSRGKNETIRAALRHFFDNVLS